LKILVPLDGSELADGILAQVGRLQHPTPPAYQLLRVLERGASSGESGEVAQQHLAQWKAKLEAQGASVSVSVEEGDPSATILEHSEKADMVAMATHGRTGMDRWIRGSVAERVLRYAEVPVFLANPAGIFPEGQAEGQGFSRVVVPLDGSNVASRILPLVVPFAKQAEIQLLGVSTPSSLPNAVPETAARKAKEHAERTLGKAAEKLKAKGLNVVIQGRYGEPAEQILEAVNPNGSDLIAMSSHGRTGLARWRFGSVAEKVLRQCTCPVLVRRVSKA
jgi:nucleotide-binding universal stress UspA family protein